MTNEIGPKDLLNSASLNQHFQGKNTPDKDKGEDRSGSTSSSTDAESQKIGPSTETDDKPINPYFGIVSLDAKVSEEIRKAESKITPVLLKLDQQSIKMLHDISVKNDREL